MRTFTDNAGRSWSISLNVTVLGRIRDEAGVDLMAAFDLESGLLEKLAADPVLLCSAVYAVCRPQAEKAGVTPEQFGESMAGDAIESAADALLDELVDFFPSRRRTILRQLADKLRALDGAILSQAEARMAGGEVDRALAEAMGGGPSGNSPGSSGSPTPAT